MTTAGQPQGNARARRRASWLPSIPRGHGDYLPLDAAERAELYLATTGNADAWPIPLTPCIP